MNYICHSGGCAGADMLAVEMKRGDEPHDVVPVLLDGHQSLPVLVDGFREVGDLVEQGTFIFGIGIGIGVGVGVGVLARLFVYALHVYTDPRHVLARLDEDVIVVSAILLVHEHRKQEPKIVQDGVDEHGHGYVFAHVGINALVDDVSQRRTEGGISVLFFRRKVGGLR